ncbi:MAG TPA: PA2779 family protein [Candidatus Acidoferrum sp.]|jgi:hypothetical protein
MKFSLKSWTFALGLAALTAFGVLPARLAAQQATPAQHVVSTDELNKDAARPADTRKANESAIRDLLSTEAGQKALQSAGVEYKRVDKAIGQLSDDDLAKIAQRSRDAQKDFAAGGISDRLLIVIILIVVLIIALALVF